MVEKFATGLSLFLSLSLILFLWVVNIEPSSATKEKTSVKKQTIEMPQENKPRLALALKPIILPPPPTKLAHAYRPLKPRYEEETRKHIPVQKFLSPTSRKKIKKSDLDRVLIPRASQKSRPTPTVRYGKVEIKELGSNSKQINNSQPEEGVHNAKVMLLDHLTPKELARGRSFLRILEHGSGPNIDIAWPDYATERQALFSMLRRCYGLKVVLVDKNNKLYQLSDEPLRAFVPDGDKISGLAREINGQISAEERQLIEGLKNHHSGIGTTKPLRLFPRKFDARLLASFSNLSSGGMKKIESLRARFRLRHSSVIVEEIEIDGRDIPGRIDLSPASRCSFS